MCTQHIHVNVFYTVLAVCGWKTGNVTYHSLIIIDYSGKQPNLPGMLSQGIKSKETSTTVEIPQFLKSFLKNHNPFSPKNLTDRQFSIVPSTQEAQGTNPVTSQPLNQSRTLRFFCDLPVQQTTVVPHPTWVFLTGAQKFHGPLNLACDLVGTLYWFSQIGLIYLCFK